MDDPIDDADAYTIGADTTAYFDGRRWIDLTGFGVGAYLDWANRSAAHEAKAIAAAQACATHEAEETDQASTTHTRSDATDQADAAARDAAHSRTEAATRSNARRRAWRVAWSWSGARRVGVAVATDANRTRATRRIAGPSAGTTTAATARAADAWRNGGRSAQARSRARSLTTPHRDS